MHIMKKVRPIQSPVHPSSSFLVAKIVVFQAGSARRPCGLVTREKIMPTRVGDV